MLGAAQASSSDFARCESPAIGIDLNRTGSAERIESGGHQFDGAFDEGRKWAVNHRLAGRGRRAAPPVRAEPLKFEFEFEFVFKFDSEFEFEFEFEFENNNSIY